MVRKVSKIKYQKHVTIKTVDYTFDYCGLFAGQQFHGKFEIPGWRVIPVYTNDVFLLEGHA